jgi:transposase InsO family protein
VLAVFTDRGSEFSSAACVDICDRAGTGAFHGPHRVVPDHAVAESFFAALKIESVERQHHRTRAEARAWIVRCGEERVTDHQSILWDRRWWPNCARSLRRPAAHPRDGVRQVGSRKSERPCWGKPATRGASMVQRRASRQLLVLDEVVHPRCGDGGWLRRTSRIWWPRCRGRSCSWQNARTSGWAWRRFGLGMLGNRWCSIW